MIDLLRPGSTLLVALAAWVLGLLVLCALGMGGRVDLHPDDPAAAPALPDVRLAQASPRLGGAGDYAEVSRRPLLSPDRRPAPVSLASDEEAPFDVILSSVLLTPTTKLAIVQDSESGASRRVLLGDVLDRTSWRLVELEPRRAVFEGPEGRRELELRVFDGSGGQAPTRVAAPAPATPVAAAAAATPDEPGKAASPGPAAPGSTAEAAEPQVMTQEQQVEAIRRRIEARRAQLREENARRNGQKVE